MIIFKDNVRFKRLTPELKRIIDVIYNINSMSIPDYPSELMITSVNDSTHMENSKHYIDKALDLRSHNFKDSIIKHQFVGRLQFELGDKFTVLLEDEGTDNEHFHIQVRKGL